MRQVVLQRGIFYPGPLRNVPDLVLASSWRVSAAACWPIIPTSVTWHFAGANICNTTPPTCKQSAHTFALALLPIPPLLSYNRTHALSWKCYSKSRQKNNTEVAKSDWGSGGGTRNWGRETPVLSVASLQSCCRVSLGSPHCSALGWQRWSHHIMSPVLTASHYDHGDQLSSHHESNDNPPGQVNI